MHRWLIAILGVVFLVGVAAVAYWVNVLAPFAKRDADSRIAFAPLYHLEPLILDNGFGVYHVEFGRNSKLTDDNAAEFLGLNLLPAEYDLTLWLKTPTITDASVPLLSQLTTTDAIVIEGAGLSASGIAQLSSANPKIRLLSADGKRLAH